MRITRQSARPPEPPPPSPPVPAWIADASPSANVVLSTRARLARNLADAAFPHRADRKTLEKTAERIVAAVQHRRSPLKTLRVVEVSALSDAEKASLVDAHLISLPLAMAGPHRFALVDDKHTVSVLVNEEDHIRIQAIHAGFQTDAAWQQADQLDDALAPHLPIAYHALSGFLTASLANAGTGLRLSVMVHMPALAFTERLEATWRAVEALGATVRGLYGEGGGSAGDVYQVSNAFSLGLTERQIVGRMAAVATFLQSEESGARDVLARVRMDDMATRVQDAERALQASERMTAEEAMVLVSTLRLGELIGIKTYVSHGFFCRFLTTLRGSIGQIASVKNRARDVFYEDTRRPASIRNKLREEIALVSPPRTATTHRA